MSLARTRRQFIRYAIVGLVSNLLLYLAYLVLTAQGLEHKMTMTLVYCSGVLATFVVNRNWSFGDGGLAHTAFLRYVISYFLGYLLNLGMLWLAVDQMGLPHQLVQACAIVVVAISVFLLHKYWVFRNVVETAAS